MSNGNEQTAQAVNRQPSLTSRPVGKTALDIFIGMLWVVGVYVAVSVAMVWLSIAMGTAATN